MCCFAFEVARYIEHVYHFFGGGAFAFSFVFVDPTRKEFRLRLYSRYFYQYKRLVAEAGILSLSRQITNSGLNSFSSFFDILD
jgi:hypothetical protein